MNCCDAYGKCTQGDDCCAREQAYDATLQNWQGGQQIEHGMPMQMFEADKPAPPVLKWYERVPPLQAFVAIGSVTGFVIGAVRYFSNN